MPSNVLASNASPFAAILSALVSRIAYAYGLLNTGSSTESAFVRPVANDDYVVSEVEDRFAYLRPYGPTPTNPSTGAPFGDYGAGRLARVVGRRVRVYVYSRSGVDVTGGDEVALLSADPSQTILSSPVIPGQFLLEEAVLNALDDWMPLGGTNGNTPLCVGPVHWIDDANGPPQRKKENDEGLVRSSLDFQVVYILAIGNLDPAVTTLPSITVPV